MLTFLQCDEELRRISVWTAVSHRENAGVGVPTLERFIFESGAFWIDAVTSRTIAFSDITALQHESVDNPMNFAAQVVQLALLPLSFTLSLSCPSKTSRSILSCIFTCAESTEILSCLWCYIVI